MMEYKIHVNEIKEMSRSLRAGDRVYLTGEVFTSRDAAHKRIKEAIEKGEKLPYNLENAVIYYVGPTPSPEHLPIGSCGPTTSSRMDPYSPLLLDKGVIAMVGKGPRNEDVCRAIERNGAVYFCAVGGAGALLAKSVKKCEVVAYEDLGCESVKKLTIENLPLVVAIDCNGGNLFKK
ncbi:MAG: fumarate hydratase C-terminal domain-containing protein [Clostridia bacterium]|nr:fumarate hydratase C-terminal domain-containing protein [Clostridia bacterium]